MDISVISVDGKNYLGIVSKDEQGGITVSDAMKFSGETIDTSDLERYITEGNVGKLSTLTFDGNGTTVTRPLSKEETVQYEMLLSAMSLIKGNAINRLENDYFNKEVN